MHSSSAVLVAVKGPTSSPVIARREEVSLVANEALREPYHAAVGLPLDEAMALIKSVEEAAAAAAASIIGDWVASLGAVGCVGVVGGDRPARTDLERILTKHALLHSSERDLFEQAIIEGSARAGLPVSTIPAKGKGTVDHASTMLGLDLTPVLAVAGKALGPPWQKDHREATAAALVALEALT